MGPSRDNSIRRSKSKSKNKKDKEVSSTPLEVEDEEVMGTTDSQKG